MIKKLLITATAMMMLTLSNTADAMTVYDYKELYISKSKGSVSKSTCNLMIELSAKGIVVGHMYQLIGVSSLYCSSLFREDDDALLAYKFNNYLRDEGRNWLMKKDEASASVGSSLKLNFPYYKIKKLEAEIQKGKLKNPG